MLSLLTGAAVNCLLILAGTLIGCLLNRKTLQKIGERIFEAFGLLVCAMGFAGSSKLDQIYLILASIIIGVALGEFFDLDGKFRRLEMCIRDRAYVRKQPWRRIYKSEVALQRGTLFNDLDKPFKGYKIGGCGCNGK